MQYGVCVYFPYPYTAEKKNARQKEEMIFFYLVVSIVSVHESYTGSHPSTSDDKTPAKPQEKWGEKQKSNSPGQPP
jgi:hypothetical protein